MVSIKIKLKSKSNSKYIKLLGMTSIEISKLVCAEDAFNWFHLYSLKRGEKEDDLLNLGAKDPIGKIKLESNFFENSSVDDEEQGSDEYSEEESIRDLERRYAKKVAQAVGGANVE